MMKNTISNQMPFKMRLHREGFSLITALFVIVLMATVTFLILNTSGKILKETTSQYRNEQARLLAKSYTELAILAVMGHDRTTNCVEKINGKLNTLNIGAADPAVGTTASNGGYDVTVDIQYIGNNFPTSGTCTMLNAQPLIETSGPNMIIDVYVVYEELDNPNPFDITYHRRTLQKL